MNLSDLEIDPIEGVEVLGYMGVHPGDVTDPVKTSQLKEVVQYFQHAGDKRYLITKLLAGKQVDAVEHLHQYVSRRKAYDSHKQELTRLGEELSIYER